jgi:hypothetical protein
MMGPTISSSGSPYDAQTCLPWPDVRVRHPTQKTHQSRWHLDSHKGRYASYIGTEQGGATGCFFVPPSLPWDRVSIRPTAAARQARRTATHRVRCPALRLAPAASGRAPGAGHWRQPKVLGVQQELLLPGILTVDHFGKAREHSNGLSAHLVRISDTKFNPRNGLRCQLTVWMCCSLNPRSLCTAKRKGIGTNNLQTRRILVRDVQNRGSKTWPSAVILEDSMGSRPRWLSI